MSKPTEHRRALLFDNEYAAKKKLTRRERFIAEISNMAPWKKLRISVELVYPKIMGAGRPRTGLAPMLRMYLVQQCFGSSDAVIDDAIYDSQAIRSPVGFDAGRENTPDATTLLKFRHLLQTNELTRQIFKTISRHLAEKSLMMHEEAVIDATLIAAPPSAKKDDSRDPAMHSSKKGND